jgi:hypothetical protein
MKSKDDCVALCVSCNVNVTYPDETLHHEESDCISRVPQRNDLGL